MRGCGGTAGPTFWACCRRGAEELLEPGGVRRRRVAGRDAGLLNFSPWDEDAARDALARYVVRAMGDPAAVLAVDETGFLKKGRMSAGVARQYTGTAGRVDAAARPPPANPTTPAEPDISDRCCSTRLAGDMSEEVTPPTFYEAVGGEKTFTQLVRRFYQEVAADPVLRPVYPAADLGPAEEHLRLFLIQYWGGPATYNELRGHPRLRMRHVRFRIGETERDLWLKHMRTALDELELPDALDAQLWDYLVMAAHSLVNHVPEDRPQAAGRGELGITPA